MAVNWKQESKLTRTLTKWRGWAEQWRKRKWVMWMQWERWNSCCKERLKRRAMIFLRYEKRQCKYFNRCIDFYCPEKFRCHLLWLQVCIEHLQLLTNQLVCTAVVIYRKCGKLKSAYNGRKKKCKGAITWILRRSKEKKLIDIGFCGFHRILEFFSGRLL